MNEKIDAYDKVKRLFELKKQNYDIKDENKIKIIERLLKNKFGFFEISSDNALKILSYLGIPNEELMNVYLELTSPENYKKYKPSVRLILPDEIAAECEKRK